jgi:hypothetical protein
MLRKNSDERVELECPECGAIVRTTARLAEEGTLRCPNGHEMAVMGILGGAPTRDKRSNR